MPAQELYIKYQSDMIGVATSSRYSYNSINGAYTQSNSGDWIDAYAEWGVSMDSTALSNLMTPAPLKEMIENKSALEDGKRVFRTGRKRDERTLTLSLNISATNDGQFLARYSAFCMNVLSRGRIDLKTKYQGGVVYHLDYLSCQNFGEYRLGLGKFALRVVEPNPADRV